MRWYHAKVQNKLKPKKTMEIMDKIMDVAKGIMSLLGVSLGIAIFSELLFGKFLGDFSVVGNLLTVTEKMGSAGLVGLVALMLIVSFVNKK